MGSKRRLDDLMMIPVSFHFYAGGCQGKRDLVACSAWYTMF